MFNLIKVLRGLSVFSVVLSLSFCAYAGWWNDGSGGGVDSFSDIGDLCAGGEYIKRNAGDTTWECDTPSGSGDVTAAAVIADNAIVRGDGGGKGVQDSGVTIGDGNDLLIPGHLAAGDTSISATATIHSYDAGGNSASTLYAFNGEITNAGAGAALGINAGAVRSGTGGSGKIYGVLGKATFTGTGTQENAYGTYGTGVLNAAGATLTNAYGIYGKAFTETAGTITDNWAGYFSGNVGLDASDYLNWGGTSGSTGYGIRDNAGSIEYKDSGGSWSGFGGGSSEWTDNTTYLEPNTSSQGAHVQFIQDTDGPGTNWSIDASGDAVFADVTIDGSTGVKASATSGVLTLSGIGNTHNESLTIDFEQDNQVDISQLLSEGILRISAGNQNQQVMLTFNDGVYDFIGFERSMIAFNQPGAISISDSGDGNPATSTTTPTRTNNVITCNDADGCEWTLGESDMPSGAFIIIRNNSANPTTIKNSAGSSNFRFDRVLQQEESIIAFYDGAEWDTIDQRDMTFDDLISKNLLLTADEYLNWGATSGSSGYGIRDNSGTIECKDSGGSWSACQDGGGSAAGNDTEIQFNDGGSTAGDSDLTWNKTTNVLTLGGTDERWTGTTNGEYIDFNDGGDDYLRFGGASGAADVYLDLLLDGEVTLKPSSGDVVISGTTVGLVPDKETADPCGSMQEGSIFYNDTSNYMCYCDGTNDVQVHNVALACF